MTGSASLGAAVALLSPHVGARFDQALRRRLARALREAALARELREEHVVELAAVEPELLRELIDRTVVPETSFFRYPEHFDVLVRHVLPQVDGPMRVWSAACSNGQEPFSVAMALAEAGARDYGIVATDVSASAVERVREACYTDRELRGLSRTRRDRFMARGGMGWEVVPELRERVTVCRSNVIEDDPPFGPGVCQAVFCRNVTIYLSPPQVVRVVERIAEWLPPGGYLFLGASESLTSLEVPLDLAEIGGVFAYRKPPAPRAAAAGRPADERATRRSAATRARPSPEHPENQVDAGAATPGPPPAPPSPDELLARGDEAARGRDWPAAVRLFRQAAYSAPAEPVPRALLGLALERSGEQRAARRAFRAARAALAEVDEPSAGLGLEGFDADALAALLEEKLGNPG